MQIEFHPHARERMATRGATEDEVRRTVLEGERFAAKHGRQGYRRNLPFAGRWRGKQFDTKQVEAYTVQDGDTIVVITVIVKYF